MKSDLAAVAAAVGRLKQYGKSFRYGGGYKEQRLAEDAEQALARIREYIKNSVPAGQPELLGGK